METASGKRPNPETQTDSFQRAAAPVQPPRGRQRSSTLNGRHCLTLQTSRVEHLPCLCAPTYHGPLAPTRPPSVFRVTNNKRRRRCGINVSSPSSSSSSSSSEAACDVLLITVTCWGCHHLSRIVTSLVHYIRKLFIVASVKVTSRTTMATQV